MSAAGVVSIALASTGFVLLCTVSSELLAPGNDDPIEMRRDYLGASRRKRGVQLYSKSSAFSGPSCRRRAEARRQDEILAPLMSRTPATPAPGGTFPRGSGIIPAGRACRRVGLRPACGPFAGGLE
jgi:hypothetical protein